MKLFKQYLTEYVGTNGVRYAGEPILAIDLRDAQGVLNHRPAGTRIVGELVARVEIPDD